jgi:hypothetical protein
MRVLSVLYFWYLLLASPTLGERRKARGKPEGVHVTRSKGSRRALQILRNVGHNRDTSEPTSKPSRSQVETPTSNVDGTTNQPNEGTDSPSASTRAPQRSSNPTGVPRSESPTDRPTLLLAAETLAPTPGPTSEPVDRASTSPSTATLPPEKCGIESLEEFWSGLGESASSDGAFKDPSSYQCQALRRVTDQVGYLEFGFSTIVKYWVLYCIYFATNGASVLSEGQGFEGGSWINAGGWQETNVDPCLGWYGITCDGASRVTEINLAHNGLNGVFPREIRYFSADGINASGAGDLQKLQVYDNEFLTNDDSFWISELGTSLRVLNYGSTAFKGPMSELPSGIEEYDCSYSLHSGVIPDSMFQGLSNLTILIMDGNNFVSPVPKSIAALPNLRFFYIRDAGLTGDLSYMQGMPSIVEHLVDRNPGLSGSIPTSLARLTTLRSFSASDCSLVRRY